MTLLSELQDLCCHLRTNCRLPAFAQGHRTCGVASGSPVPHLPLNRDLQYMLCHLRTPCQLLLRDPHRTFAVVSGPTAPCKLLREPQDLWCCFVTLCPLPAACSGTLMTYDIGS